MDFSSLAGPTSSSPTDSSNLLATSLYGASGTGGSSDDSSDDTSIWTSLIASIPGDLTGTAKVIAATKGTQYYNNGIPVVQSPVANSSLIWIGIGVLVIVLLFVFMNKRPA